MNGDLDIPAGSATSPKPIEGGVCVLNAAYPPGHGDAEVWRTPTNAELQERTDFAAAWAVRTRQARRAMLRIERDRRLIASDWTELPSAAARHTADELAAWAAYRQALRDLPATTTDPDNPAWPAPPSTTTLEPAPTQPSAPSG